MKTEMEIDGGHMTITSIDGNFTIVLDIQSGEVLEFGYTHANISEMRQFVHKARARYNKFLSTKAVDDFM